MGKRQGTPDDLLGQLLGSVSTETRGGLHWVPLARILDNPYQARQEDDLDHIVGLAKSMAQLKAQLPATLGLQQPPTGRLVRIYGDEYEPFDPFVYKQERTIRELLASDDVYVQLHFGHSRRQAFRLLAQGVQAVWPEMDIPEQFDMGVDRDEAYSSMPLFLAHADKRTMFVHVATENAARKDLSAVEEAALLKRAIDEHGMSVEEAGAVFGWARSTAANKLRLLDLPEDVQKMIRRGTISERAARELVRLVGAPKYLQQTVQTITQGDGISIGRLVSDVNYRLDQAKKEQAAQAELDTAAAVLANGWEPWPGAGVLGVDRLGPQTNVPGWQHEAFRQNSEACKVCTGNCPCMRVIRQEYGDGVGKFQVSAAAPNVVLACASRSRQDKLLQAWREKVKGDRQLAAEAAQVAIEVDQEAARQEQERREKLLTLQREGDEIWIEFRERINRQELWGSLAFWQQVAAAVRWGLDEALNAVDTPEAAVDALLERMRKGVCWKYDKDVGEFVFEPKALREMIAKIENRKRKAKKEEAPAAAADETLPVL